MSAKDIIIERAATDCHDFMIAGSCEPTVQIAGLNKIITRACEEAWESGYQTAYGIVLKQMNELQQLRDKHEEAKGAYKAEIKSHARTEKMRKQAEADTKRLQDELDKLRGI